MSVSPAEAVFSLRLDFMLVILANDLRSLLLLWLLYGMGNAVHCGNLLIMIYMYVHSVTCMR